MIQQGDPAAGSAWYVYAVLPPGAVLPHCAEAIMPGAEVQLIRQAPDRFGCVASLVPSALFTSPDSRAGVNDPDWVAARATAHHAVVGAAGTCLPLGFGTLFSSLAALHAWLAAQASAIDRAFTQVAGQQEWVVQLTEDPEQHATWLTQHDPALLQLTQEAAVASPGRGFLLARRLSQAVHAAREGRAAAACANVDAVLASLLWPSRGEPARPGRTAWAVLAPDDVDLTHSLADLGCRLAGTGLTLRLAGPLPPYGFARAAWTEVSCAA